MDIRLRLRPQLVFFNTMSWGKPILKKELRRQHALENTMEKSSQTSTTKHIVSLRIFEASIHKVMEETSTLLSGRPTQPYLPMMVGIDVDYNGQTDAAIAFRTFFKGLRGIHQKHFVRFTTDTLWAMESDNDDIFYTLDGPKDAVCAAVWSVTLIDAQHVEISVNIQQRMRQDELINQVSRNLRQFVIGVQGEFTKNKLMDVMLNFYQKTSGMDQLKTLKENVHVLMIPNITESGYYPIPIYGMSYFDAMRRCRKIVNQFTHQRRMFHDCLRDDLGIGDIVCMILDLIQSNERFGVQHKVAQEIYGLAELLFALFVDVKTSNKNNHDLILFHSANRRAKEINTYRFDMNTIFAD